MHYYLSCTLGDRIPSPTNNQQHSQLHSSQSPIPNPQSPV
ncbi:ectonucleotide pyrophosphatase/phosphodiesterase 1 [Tolypothrix sp. PCC 7601]|nr:ectonucleotide pyrophosphatase/phosphodiesterase 1 [Tolypothrix sp. PCC 7601]